MHLSLPSLKNISYQIHKTFRMKGSNLRENTVMLVKPPFHSSSLFHYLITLSFVMSALGLSDKMNDSSSSRFFRVTSLQSSIYICMYRAFQQTLTHTSVLQSGKGLSGSKTHNKSIISYLRQLRESHTLPSTPPGLDLSCNLRV